MASEIKTGTVVKLKSGGPRMTVKWVEKGDAACTWFDANGKKFESKFAIAQLEPADD